MYSSLVQTIGLPSKVKPLWGLPWFSLGFIVPWHGLQFFWNVWHLLSWWSFSYWYKYSWTSIVMEMGLSWEWKRFISSSTLVYIFGLLAYSPLGLNSGPFVVLGSQKRLDQLLNILVGPRIGYLKKYSYQPGHGILVLLKTFIAGLLKYWVQDWFSAGIGQTYPWNWSWYNALVVP